MGSSVDQSAAEELHVGSHVPTRQTPSSRGFFTKSSHKASRQNSLPSSNTFGSTRRLKKIDKETGAVSGSNTPPEAAPKKEKRRIVKESKTAKKEVPSPLPKEMTEDPLVGRFERLRLPPTGTGTASSARRRKDPSQTSQDEPSATPTRHKTNLSSINYFQSAGPSPQSSDRRRSREDRLSQNKVVHRSRSPYSSDSSSEGILTPDSLESSHEDISSHFAQFVQEEQDLLLAQRLQDEEVGLHAQSLERPNARQQDVVTTTPSGKPFSKAKVHHKHVRSSQKRTVASKGTRENQISLDSEPEKPRTTKPNRWRIQDYVARHGEPMDIDGMDQFKPRHAKRTLSAPKKKKREPEPRAHKRSRDCAVCGESVPIADLPSLANCSHQPETCADCYTGWIAAQLQDSSWREVTCPGSECKVKLSYHEIQSYATPETFQQYDTFIARAAVSDDPNFRWCRACHSGQIHLSSVDEGNIFTCADCGHKVCTVHENTWHQGETCDEYEYRNSGRKERDQRKQEEASLKAIGKLTKKCPGPGCTWNIEKNEGCDHMTCSKCRYEFCWICLCDYNKVRREGNAAHVETCKYHTERLP